LNSSFLLFILTNYKQFLIFILQLYNFTTFFLIFAHSKIKYNFS